NRAARDAGRAPRSRHCAAAWRGSRHTLRRMALAQPALYMPGKIIAHAGILDSRYGLGGEGVDEHAARFWLADAARAQIEQRVLVEVADSGAVAALDVVGENLELGLGVDRGARAQQQIAVEQLGIGLLCLRPDGDAAEEHAMGALL